jgi:hypothetical protein
MHPFISSFLVERVLTILLHTLHGQQLYFFRILPARCWVARRCHGTTMTPPGNLQRIPAQVIQYTLLAVIAQVESYLQAFIAITRQ